MCGIIGALTLPGSSLELQNPTFRLCVIKWLIEALMAQIHGLM